MNRGILRFRGISIVRFDVNIYALGFSFEKDNGVLGLRDFGVNLGALGFKADRSHVDSKSSKVLIQLMSPYFDKYDHQRKSKRTLEKSCQIHRLRDSTYSQRLVNDVSNSIKYYHETHQILHDLNAPRPNRHGSSG